MNLFYKKIKLIIEKTWKQIKVKTKKWHKKDKASEMNGEINRSHNKKVGIGF